MSVRSFAQLLEHIGQGGGPKRCALAGAEHVHAVEAVWEAKKRGAVDPILFGDESRTAAALRELGVPGNEMELVHCASPEQAAAAAVERVRDGGADLVMKGQVETGTLMKRLLDRDKGLRAGRVAHSVAFAEVETHHKLLACTDAAILIRPTLEQKAEMIGNTVAAMRRMGWEWPLVAVLSATETPNPDIPGSLDARELRDRNRDGRIRDCVVEGPIAFDLAVSREAAALKQFCSPVAGEADLLIYPDINAGNIALKTLTMTGRNRTGSVVLGLRAPVVMSSRGSSADNKLRSLLLAAAMA